MHAQAHRLHRRLPGVFVAVGCASLTGLVSAAALNGLGSPLLGSGKAPVAACDSDGFSLTHTLSGSTVTDVTVAGIDALCATGTVTITLTDGAGIEVSSGGPQTVPSGGGSVVISLSPAVETTAFANHHVRIDGP